MSDPVAADARRADAVRNRARILQVAAAALSTDPDLSLNAVAKLAEVGPGTLYRHFPNREALLLAVYQEEVDTVVASVTTLLAEHAPLDAFRIWSRRLAAHARVKHGLGEALTSAAAQVVIGATWGPVSDAIRRLLDAAAATNEIPAPVDPTDVVLLLSALWRVPAGEEGLIQADRLLELIVAALRCAPDESQS